MDDYKKNSVCVVFSQNQIRKYSYCQYLTGVNPVEDDATMETNPVYDVVRKTNIDEQDTDYYADTVYCI